MMTNQQAILVMESRGVTPGTRSFQFSDAWSRLYQVGEYFVDLMYQPSNRVGKLHGQVLRKDGQAQTFRGSAQLEGEAPIGPDGQFDLSVDRSGEADLTLFLNDKVIEVNGVSFLKATMF